MRTVKFLILALIFASMSLGSKRSGCFVFDSRAGQGALGCRESFSCLGDHKVGGSAESSLTAERGPSCILYKK